MSRRATKTSSTPVDPVTTNNAASASRQVLTPLLAICDQPDNPLGARTAGAGPEDNADSAIGGTSPSR